MTWGAEIRASLPDFRLDVAVGGGTRPVALVGPNGSGKSTTLRIIAGALRPEHGRIVVGERTLFSSEQRTNLPTEQRRVGYLPQGFGFFEHLNVLDNVAFGPVVRGSAKSEVHPRARVMLASLEVDDLAERMPRQLSGGEQQRVALARALITEPDLLLLDEPLAALDATTRRSVRRFLASHITSAGCPAVIVTHDVRDLHAIDCDIFVFDRGQIVQRGSLEQLTENPVNGFVEEFVGLNP